MIKICSHFVVPIRSNLEAHLTDKEAGLWRSLSLALALGVTKFEVFIVTNLDTLCCRIFKHKSYILRVFAEHQSVTK
jgi:hypothetical protein